MEFFLGLPRFLFGVFSFGSKPKPVSISLYDGLIMISSQSVLFDVIFFALLSFDIIFPWVHSSRTFLSKKSEMPKRLIELKRGWRRFHGRFINKVLVITHR